MIVGLLTCLEVGCTEPSYGAPPGENNPTRMNSDAGVSDPGTRDAQAEESRVTRVELVPDAEIPNDAAPIQGDDAGSEWWARLHKNYAVRIRFFGRDRALGQVVDLKHEIVLLGQVSIEEGGRVAMQTQRCRDHGVLRSIGGLTDEFHWLFPEKLPLEHHELVLRDGKVQTVAAPRALGYEAAQPTDCTVGGKLPSRPEQVWLAGASCRCGAEPLPTLADDCRVTDPDDDSKPGFTVQHSISSIGQEGARAKDSSQIVDGTLSADGRIRASFIENYDFLGLTCGTSPCGHNDIVVCPLALNPVQFEPLPEKSAAGVAWDCAAVLEQVDAGKYFTSEMFTFPSGC